MVLETVPYDWAQAFQFAYRSASRLGQRVYVRKHCNAYMCKLWTLSIKDSGDGTTDMP